MSSFFELFISELKEVSEIDQLTGSFIKIIKSYDFDRMALCLYSDHADINMKAEIAVVHNFPQKWIDRYYAENLIRIDPINILVRTKDKPFRWNDIRQEMKLTLKQEYFLKQLEEADLYNGFGVPIWGHNSLAVVWLARSVRGDDSHIDATLLPYYCRLYYEYFVKLHKQKHQKEDAALLSSGATGCSDVALSVREIQILKLAAQGEHDAEIARRLNISTHTVDATFRSIYKKLSAKTRTEAVASALSKHLIWL